MQYTYNQYELKEVYEGDFNDDEMSGDGRILFKDTSVYYGEMKNNSCEGYGTMTWENGKKYQGFFKNNYKHGEGIYSTKIDGKEKSFHAEFENGVVKSWIATDVNPDEVKL